jgi:hypothetical protein
LIVAWVNVDTNEPTTGETFEQIVVLGGRVDGQLVASRY